MKILIVKIKVRVVKILHPKNRQIQILSFYKSSNLLQFGWSWFYGHSKKRNYNNFITRVLFEDTLNGIEWIGFVIFKFSMKQYSGERKNCSQSSFKVNVRCCKKNKKFLQYFRNLNQLCIFWMDIPWSPRCPVQPAM